MKVSRSRRCSMRYRGGEDVLAACASARGRGGDAGASTVDAYARWRCGHCVGRSGRRDAACLVHKSIAHRRIPVGADSEWRRGGLPHPVMVRSEGNLIVAWTSRSSAAKAGDSAIIKIRRISRSETKSRAAAVAFLHRAKPPFWNPGEQLLPEERSRDDADCGERDRRPERRDLCRLQRQVNRNPRHVDQQRDRSGRCDELPLVDIESQHDGVANAALIPDQPTEESREGSAKPRERAAKAPSFCGAVPATRRSTSSDPKTISSARLTPTCSAGRG